MREDETPIPWKQLVQSARRTASRRPVDNRYRRDRRVAMPARSGQTSSVCNLSSASPSCFSAQGFSTMSVTPRSRSSSSSIGSV